MTQQRTRISEQQITLLKTIANAGRGHGASQDDFHGALWAHNRHKADPPAPEPSVPIRPAQEPAVATAELLLF